MKLAMVGSPVNINEEVFDQLFDLALERFTGVHTILTTGTNGVDRNVARRAKQHNLDVVIFEPYHKLNHTAKFKPVYFFIRNKELVRNADRVIAFWDGQSNETKHIIEYAQQRGLQVDIYDLEKLRAIKESEAVS